jgi:solute carrier family 25 (mitochondrial phosphate transporter), member 3
LKGFTFGWHATLIGYSCQGFGKFGFYEIFKDVYKWALGPKASQYQTIGFLASSACAEVIADTFLAPFEAVSIFLDKSRLSPLFFYIEYKLIMCRVD